MVKNKTPLSSGLEKKLYTVARWFSIISAGSLLAMTIVTAIDVFGRWLFVKPFYGAYELVGSLLIIAGPFSMAVTQLEKRHISISLVVDLLPSILKKLLSSIGFLLDLFVYGMITIGMVVLSYIFWQRGSLAISEDLGFRLIYLSISFSLASLLFTVVILVHFTQSIHALLKKR